MLTSPDLDAESQREDQNPYCELADSLPVGCCVPEDPSPDDTDGEPQLVSTLTTYNDDDVKDQQLEVEENQGLKVIEESARSQKRGRFHGLRLPELLYPKSAYQDDECTTSISQEESVIRNIFV